MIIMSWSKIELRHVATDRDCDTCGNILWTLGCYNLGKQTIKNDGGVVRENEYNCSRCRHGGLHRWHLQSATVDTKTKKHEISRNSFWKYLSSPLCHLIDRQGATSEQRAWVEFNGVQKKIPHWQTPAKGGSKARPMIINMRTCVSIPHLVMLTL